MNSFTLTFLDIGTIILALVGVFGAMSRSVNDKLRELAHRLNNERMRLDALERFRTADVERIARLEANYESLKDDCRDIKGKLDHIIDRMGGR